jgi:hypothetical protein
VIADGGREENPTATKKGGLLFYSCYKVRFMFVRVFQSGRGRRSTAPTTNTVVLDFVEVDTCKFTQNYTIRTGILKGTDSPDFNYLAMRICAENSFILQFKYSQKMFAV